MLVTSTTTTISSTPTPGSSSSTCNTLEPLPVSHQVAPSANNSRPPSRATSILDSPTLARVERARLRLEASAAQQQQHRHHHMHNDSNGSQMGTLNREDSLERSILDFKTSKPAEEYYCNRQYNMLFGQYKWMRIQ